MVFRLGLLMYLSHDTTLFFSCYLPFNRLISLIIHIGIVTSDQYAFPHLSSYLHNAELTKRFIIHIFFDGGSQAHFFSFFDAASFAPRTTSSTPAVSPLSAFTPASLSLASCSFQYPFPDFTSLRVSSLCDSYTFGRSSLSVWISAWYLQYISEWVRRGGKYHDQIPSVPVEWKMLRMQLLMKRSTWLAER